MANRTNPDSPARVFVDVLEKYTDGSRFGGSIKQVEFVEAAAYDEAAAELTALRAAAQEMVEMVGALITAGLDETDEQFAIRGRLMQALGTVR